MICILGFVVPFSYKNKEAFGLFFRMKKQINDSLQHWLIMQLNINVTTVSAGMPDPDSEAYG